MSYVDVYRMWFTNDKGHDVIVHISDTTSGTGTTTFHDMQDADGKELIMSAKLSTANDGEDKLSIIRSLRFSCEFLSTDTYNVDFFVEGEDNRWLVEVLCRINVSEPNIYRLLSSRGSKRCISLTTWPLWCGADGKRFTAVNRGAATKKRYSRSKG
jgi:hypothetical protein